METVKHISLYNSRIGELLFGHIDEELINASYENRFDTVTKLMKYEKELTQDGFVEFGAIYHDDDLLVEVLAAGRNTSNFGEPTGKPSIIS